MDLIRSISVERFNAYTLWTKYPGVEYFCQELEWYATTNDHLLGVLIRSRVDNVYAYIVLARDEKSRFRCIKHSEYLLINQARTALMNALKINHYKDAECYNQHDAKKREGVDLFSPIVEDKKLHPYFKKLMNDKWQVPAKKMISEIMHNFIDIDGSFVREFQTNGFSARVWEIYLYAFFKEAGFECNREFNAPDFFLSKDGKKIFVEAVTVNPTKGEEYIDDVTQNLKELKDIGGFEELQGQIFPIKFGSSLYSKVNRKPPYWELEHVKGNPLILAIADFHRPQAMLLSSSSIYTYLYGTIQEEYIEDGKVKVNAIKVDKHVHPKTKKEIPSGFFFQPNVQYISGILFTSSGTIAKFTRMGALAGFAEMKQRIFRKGICLHCEENRASPKFFSHEVRPGIIKESWAEGMEFYHNPNALIPIDDDIFPHDMVRHRYENGIIFTYAPEFHPLSSITFNFL